MAASTPGKVYVGRYDPKTRSLPRLPSGVKPILIHTAATGLGGPLSPYQLRDRRGRLLENMWQFSKVYPAVTAQRQLRTRFRPSEPPIWEWPAEVHLDKKGNPTAAYWEWRRKGFAAEYAIRYPNGFAGRHNCAYSLGYRAKEGKPGPKLDYIAARKAIYCKLYVKLAVGHPALLKLQKLLDQGQSLCIIEVDGPDLSYYVESPIADRIRRGVLKIDGQEVIEYLLNDPGRPFGHGFVLAALLKGGAGWLE